MNAETLYYIGLGLVLAYIIVGFDDFVWDIISLIKRLQMKNQVIDMNRVREIPPKLIGVVIAAWHEDNVMFDVVENIILSQKYPKSMYHVFLGVYPNDMATVNVAKELESKYPNVHCVINYKEGPTSKAQNINYIISQIRELEKANTWRFSTITVHDSEDVVHPYEFTITNFLIEKHAAVQFPVFPLIKKPTFKNLFEYITTNTYVDEFAENHYITMVGRRNTGAFVPSAGTGFSLSRETIDSLGYDVLPENSLTEDYRLSLTLYENGIQMYYVMEKLDRVDYEGNIKQEYIATRSMFPNTFKTAVKQKTRWILGITMQSLSFKDIFKENLSFMGRYSIYRDQKAKFVNLFSMIGYPVFIYFLFSLFLPLPDIFPLYSLSWYLCFVVTIMMIERQIFRGVSLKNVYGWRSVFFGCLFPPILPIRIIWGNIINLVATINAYIQFFKGKKGEKAKKTKVKAHSEKALPVRINKNKVNRKKELTKFKWSKTDHAFLEKDILIRFHRRFGDILITSGYITANDLKEALEEKGDDTAIGEYLLSRGIITENIFIDVLTSVKNIPVLLSDSLYLYDLRRFKYDFKEEFLRENNILPILKTGQGYVFVYGFSSPMRIQSHLRKNWDLDNQSIIALDSAIERGISLIYGDPRPLLPKALDELLMDDKINAEQIVLIRNYASSQDEDEFIIANRMGICKTSI